MDGNNSIKLDDPPNSRLFIVCSKQITESDFRQAFGQFGVIEEVWLLKDKLSKTPKGITYIKFSKTSEAAAAMEEMNGKSIGGCPRPLKVLIAHARQQGSKREMNEDERLLRLFVVVPKDFGEPDVRAHFDRFGDVDYVSVVKDRQTRESKGFAYVKYHRMSHAAKAFEDCDRSFKPVFADPKPTQRTKGSASVASGSSFDHLEEGRVLVTLSSSISQDLAWRLFDLIPGLERSDIVSGEASKASSKTYSVLYGTTQSANHARDKLNGFEYPPGYRISAKLPSFGTAAADHHNHRLRLDLANLTETIATATAYLQQQQQPQQHYVSGGSASTTYDPAYCSVSLPPPKPLAPVDSDVAERLFIVCSPSPPPVYALKDVFGRFGSLIDIYIINHKTYGYAKYANKESADSVVAALHGQEVCGSRLKVMLADPYNDKGRKRPKIE